MIPYAIATSADATLSYLEWSGIVEMQEITVLMFL